MRILTALLLAVLALSPAPAADKRHPAPEFKKSEHILKWINDYRHAPDPDRLPEVVRARNQSIAARSLAKM